MRLSNPCSTRNKYIKWFNISMRFFQPKLLIKSLDHLGTKITISFCCILRDLIFLFITLSPEPLLVDLRNDFCFIDLLTEPLLFPNCLYQNYLKNELWFQWLHRSPVDHMGPMLRPMSQLTLRNALSTIVGNRSTREKFWLITLITPGSESLLTFVGRFPLKSYFSSLNG